MARMIEKRDTYKYYFKRGNKILYAGITDDLERREKEHKNNIDKRGHILQVGRITTRDAAQKWERNRKGEAFQLRKKTYNANPNGVDGTVNISV